VSQDFHLARFEEFREKGMAAHRAGQWKDARYNLLRASEHLFKLAEASAEGRIKEQRKAGAQKLLELASGIDPDAPPPRSAGGAGRGGGARAAAAGGAGGAGGKGDREAAKDDDESKRFAAAERPTTRFSDVAGLEDVKEQVRLKLLYPIRHAEKAKKYGIKTGGGVLLYGPPGTGKTLIARAIAGEIEAAFFTVKPSEIMSKWVGEAEQNIEALFVTARREPLSIIFIDEIEALVPARRDAQSSVMQRLVPQILAELEGFDTAGKNPILFLGATNEPWSLDPAVLRPGRFDEKIYIGLPDRPARRAMLDMYLKKRPLGPGLDLDGLAERLEGYSGADIRNLCDKAAAEAFLASIETGHDATIDAELIERVLAETRPSVRAEDVARFLRYSETGATGAA
jgi:transitional endoplasmic reticulum ATPase